MLSALIFDFDGLIIDSETAVARSWLELYAREGVPFPYEVWRSMVGTREHDGALWCHLAEKTGRAYDVDALDAARKARSLEIANRLPVLPGVTGHLDAARDAGLGLAVASSSSDWWVEGHLERLGLRTAFDVICTKGDVARSKPFPDIYLKALERLGVPASDAVAFEDSEHGIAAAKAAGLRVIAVPGSFCEHMDFRKADIVLDSLADLPPALLLGT